MVRVAYEDTDASSNQHYYPLAARITRTPLFC
jgi:hypothetical protein